MRTASIAILVLAAVAFHAPAHAKVPPCPGGRYLVTGGRLAGDLDVASMDVVEMTGKMVGVASGCAAVKSRVRATRGGTKVRARFRSCSGFAGKAILNGTITEHCRTLAGTFVAKSAGIVQPFLASLSACGDGIWDPDGGEACDAGLGPCGDLCNACACAGATTTTVTGTTSPTSTVPGATSTTTGTSPSSSTTTTPTSPTTSTTGGGGGTSSTTTPTTSTNPPTTTTTSGGGTTSSSMPALPTTTTTSTTLMGADLVPISWMSPGVVVGGGTVAIEFIVKNFGTATAIQPWYDYILFSTDTAIGGDTAIGLPQRVANVVSGGQYTVFHQPVVPKVPSGGYYFFLHTDGAGSVAENNETNNFTGFVAVTVTNPELIPTAFTGPATGTAGAGISVSYTVKNQGNAAAFGPWSDRVFLSTDASFGGDTQIGMFANGANLAINGTYSAMQSVTLPSVPTGTYYLFFQADAADALYEGGVEANNVRGPVTIMIN